MSNCLDECAKEVVDYEAVNASTFQGVVIDCTCASVNNISH